MANEFITIKEIARTALPRLMENLVFPNLVYRDFSGDFARNLGDKIQVRKPAVLEAKDFDAVVGITPQDLKEESVEVALDRIATVDVDITALQGATCIDDITRQFIEPAAAALAKKINSDGLALYADINAVAGTAGTTPGTLEDLAAVRRVLNKNCVPASPRYAVWDTEADTKFTTVDALISAEKCGGTQALRDGAIGRVFGLNNYMSQAIKLHKTGVTTATDLKVSSTVEAGSTKLGVKGTALAGRFVKGDLLTIGGSTYTVTKDSAEAAANAIANVEVYPALSALEGDTAVTLVADHTANLAFHPMAFAFVTRPLTQPAGVESYVTNYNGLSLRVVRGYNMTYKKEMLSMDVLYSFKTMYPELAVRVLG